MTGKKVGSRLFDGINVTLLVLFALITIIPFIHVIASSFASVEAYNKSNFMLFPTELSLNAYEYIFRTDALPRSMGVTIFITVAGTLVNLLFTSLLAYSVSRKKVHFRRTILFFVVFTIIFQWGLIPDYLVVKQMVMLDSYWALIIPRAIIPCYLIILISFFRNLPDEMEESARIDGCGDLRMLFRIV